MIAQINDSGADVLWVAFGCPKQELWMFENRDRMDARHSTLTRGKCDKPHDGREITG